MPLPAWRLDEASFFFFFFSALDFGEFLAEFTLKVSFLESPLICSLKPMFINSTTHLLKNHQDSENLGFWPDPACVEADSQEHREIREENVQTPQGSEL